MSVKREPGRRAGFRGDIEGLRGVAVLLVVLGHLTGWPRGGFVGVDVFFVISGFLITGLLVAERERSGRVSLRNFYLRRARRLLPAGVLVLVVTDVAASMLLLSTRAHATVIDSLWSLGFLANVHFAALGTDYFSSTRAPSAVQHYWSLSVEEQFYLVWPCLMMAGLALAARGRRGLAAAARGRRRLVAVTAVIVAASLTWSVLSTAHTPAAAYFSSPARAWELGAGALLVLLSPRVPAVLAWLGGAGLLLSVFVITPATAVPGYALLLPVLSTVAILAAGGDRIGLGTSPLRYVGRISYSLYLWHWPCMILGSTLPGGTTALGRTGLLALAGLLSVASYHLVEQPARNRAWFVHRPGRRLGHPALVPALGALVALTVAATWFGTRPVAVASGSVASAQLSVAQLGGDIRAALHPQTWPQNLGAELVDAAAPEWVHDHCLDINRTNVGRCVYGSRSAPHRLAVVGDSVAVSWLPALRSSAALGGWEIDVLTQRQCPNVAVGVSRSCTAHQDWVVAQLAQLHPDVVLLSNRYEGKATPEQWQDGLRDMLTRLGPSTPGLVVLTPAPDTADLQRCFSPTATPADCVVGISSRWRSYAAAERAAAAARLVHFVDTSSWVCASEACPAVVAGLPVTFDGRHLTAAYTRRIAPLVSAAVIR